MKARIPGSRALLKPDKKAVRDYVDQHQKAVTRRLLKLACVTLHLHFGFGKEEPQRCDSGVERHDFGEKEGARKWLTEAM